MDRFDLQGVGLETTKDAAFDYVADPRHLPEWTRAFAAAGPDGRATLRTPSGEVAIELEVAADRSSGTIDWTLRFPDGGVARAFSRLIDAGHGRSVYTFVLLPPPAPLEALEGAFEEQKATLRRELADLKEVLDRAAS